MIPEITHSFAMTLDFLRRLVADVDDGMMTAQAGDVVNHPAWTIGHLVYSCQGMAGELGVPGWLPEDWAARFGTGSTPLADRAAYPSKRELLDRLQEGQRRLVEALNSISESDLSVPLPDEQCRDLLPTLGHAVVHILVAHAAEHVGQIIVWRRVLGLGPLREVFI
ncbi:MAG TPA: DinB family protein [Thermoguttaceae bacterium]|nr:DinB family protein [Thermoguttaceae bacterium]